MFLDTPFQSHCRKQHSSIFAFVSKAAVLMGMMACLTGCSTLNPNGKTALPTDNQAAPVGVYQVEMEGPFGNSVFQGDLKSPVYIQDALERSGAIKKFRGMEISIYRVVSDSRQPLILKPTYTRSSKSVKDAENYEIKANDRIVIKSRSTTGLDRIVESFTGGSSTR